MARKLGTFKGTEAGLPQRFADDPVMISRTGTFSSFTDDNDTSYNISRASNSGSTSTWDTHHVLIHSVNIINTSDDNLCFIYFYQDNNTSDANALNATDRMFYIPVAGSNDDRASNSIKIDFPIPLCVRGGCVITSNRLGCIIDINYTILNTNLTSDYDNILKYKYLTADSSQHRAADDLHGTLGTITSDIEIWGGLVYNHSTSNDDYNDAYITSTGESDAVKATLSANEQKSDTDDASAAFTGTYSAQFFPYPVICKGGAKLVINASDDNSVYTTWFFRQRKSKSVETIGWA